MKYIARVYGSLHNLIQLSYIFINIYYIMYYKLIFFMEATMGYVMCMYTNDYEEKNNSSVKTESNEKINESKLTQEELEAIKE